MGELLIILAVALLFLGPKRLPKLASDLGKAVRSFRRATTDLQEQVGSELRAMEDRVAQPSLTQPPRAAKAPDATPADVEAVVAPRSPSDVTPP
jgi:TatA/E family protein of Tat protein translocase